MPYAARAPRARPPLARAVAIAAVTLALALALRHLAIEPVAIAHACDPSPWVGPCALRSVAVRLFLHQEIGWLSCVAGVIALGRHSVRAADVALAAGAAGLVLYSADPSAVGALLGLVVRVRASVQPPSSAHSPA